MNTISQDILDTVFDEVTRQVTENVGGIRLYRGDIPPSGELYTVHAAFQRGFHSSLSLCADASVFTRLTQYIMQDTNVTPQDIEDFSKEYLNVLCGHVASRLFQVTKVASRFGIPSFHSGRYQPEGQEDQFVINYFSDKNEGVQLIHHAPVIEQNKQDGN